MQLAPLQKLSITAGLALVALGVVVAVSYYYASRRATADLIVERANANLSAAFRVVTARQDGERAAKAYVVRPDSVVRAALQDAQSQVEEALDVMARGTEDNPRQRTLLTLLASGAAASFEAFRATVLIRDRAGADSARRFLSGEPSAAVSDSLMKLVSLMRDEELRVLAEQTRQQTLFGATAQRLILIGMVFTLLLAGLALQPMRETVSARMTSHLAREQINDAEQLAEAARINAVVSAAQLLALHQVVAALSDTRDAATSTRVVADAAVVTLGATLAVVIVPDGAGGLTALATSGGAFDGVSPALARPVAEVLRTGEATMWESREEREQRWGAIADLDACGARGSAILAPMVHRETVTGVLVIGHADDHVFGDDELTFTTTLGRLGGHVVVSRPTAS
ncbi:MAG: GAF domain-containing protein [Gemmatimonadetes bacterium]|nr:GAF domain-containing protein [Gemmatimonadota bacterium]